MGNSSVVESPPVVVQEVGANVDEQPCGAECVSRNRARSNCDVCASAAQLTGLIHILVGDYRTSI
jgi:hypothetical protein